MISVTNIVKKFGSTVAVDGISFEVPKGQVVGFLGPNGAGKTTTMRLLTGYLPPDDGEATILGRSLRDDSVHVRRHLGYLPENNPLPDDIEVTDYLHYVGLLRGLKDAGDRLARVKSVLKSCSLFAVVGKKLGELSKGYRQRVGLAAAILHDPDVLILDEPTSGLDPNQVQDVRELIQNLKSEKTLILSTHILSEVQSTCDRIIIINNGRIVADGTPDLLRGSVQTATRLMVSLKGPAEQVQAALEKLGGVQAVRMHEKSNGESSFVLETAADSDLREDIFHLAVQNKWPILSLSRERLGLEDVFRALTRGEGESS